MPLAMKSLYPYFVLLFSFVLSCKNEKVAVDPPVEEMVEIPLTDTSRVFMSSDFEKYLIQKGIDPVTKEDGFVLYRYIKNVDSLQLDAPLSPGTSLKGIEGFTNLRYFRSEGLKVDSLNLSNNKKLEHFEYWPYAHCMDCSSVRVLNFGKINSLKKIDLRGSLVGALDLAGCKMLRSIYVRNNINLKQLDLSHCESLEGIYVLEKAGIKLGNHPKLVDLTSAYIADVSKSPILEKWTLGSTGSGNIDVSHNPELKSLHIGETVSSALNLTLCPKLESLEVYGHGDWKMDKLDLSNNKMLKYCRLLGTGLRTICVSSLTETDFTFWEKDSGASYIKCN